MAAMAEHTLTALADVEAFHTTPDSLQPRTVETSQDYLAEIVGQETLAGQRIQAGPILKLMCDTAVAVGLRHCGQRPVMLRLDRIDLTRVICHLDLVRIEGRMVEVGRSSMMAEVRCYNKRPTEREFNLCHVGFLTMVAIDPDGRPVRAIPPLGYDTPQGRVSKALAAHRRAEIEERRAALEWIDREERLRVEDVLEPMEAERYNCLRPADTEVRLKSQVMASSPQPDGRVRAGDLLVWLDRVASYTARQFCRNDHLVTLSLNDVVFKRALHATDRIELISRVTYVRTHTLEVAVDVIVHTLDGEQHPLDRVEFFLVNFSPSGAKRRITTGLTLNEDDQESLRMYLKARTRFSFWKAHPESHLTQLAQ
jgi:acyl-CoA hydrolase